MCGRDQVLFERDQLWKIFLGSLGNQDTNWGLDNYERICPDFVKVVIFFVYGRNICIILEMQTEVLQGGMARCLWCAVKFFSIN